MITSLERVSGLGVFKNFVRPAAGLSDFTRRNLIYGWNYSGKTTLSRLFASLERKALHEDFPNATFEVRLANSTTYTEATISAFPLQVRVFNTDYVRANVVWDRELQPILLVGAVNVALQEGLQRLQRRIGRRRQYLEYLRRTAAELEEKLDSRATDVATTVRATLSVTPFTRVRVEQLVEEIGDQYPQLVLPDAAVSAEMKKRHAEPREPLPLVPEAADLAPLISTARELLRRTVSRHALERLAASRPLEEWVEQGVPLHAGASRCQFCDQPLPRELMGRLAEHFSTSYSELKSEIEVHAGKLTASNIVLSPPDETRLFSHLRDDYTRLRAEWREHAARLNGNLITLQEELANKLAKPDTPLEATLPDEAFSVESLNRTIGKINDLFADHNSRSSQYEQQRSEAQQRLLKHIIARYITDNDYFQTKKHISRLVSRRAHNQALLTAQEARELQLQASLSDEVRGAEKINEYLEKWPHSFRQFRGCL